MERGGNISCSKRNPIRVPSKAQVIKPLTPKPSGTWHVDREPHALLGLPTMSLGVED